MTDEQILAVVGCRNTWTSMRNRCTPGKSASKNWGDRGITVCEEWDDKLTFIRWSLENGYADTLSLDRIDNDRGYTPENCRWATAAEQSQNTRRTKLSMVKAREIRALRGYLTCKEIADFYGIHHKSVPKITANLIWKEPEPISRPIWIISDEEILNITRLLIDWRNMKHRVSSVCKQHKHYYDKGVAMCDEWANDFTVYYRWAIANGSQRGLTIDRIDNDGDYCPENCRFATPRVQNQNKCNSIREPTVRQVERLCVETDLSTSLIAKICGINISSVSVIRYGRHCHSTLPYIEPIAGGPGIQPDIVKQIEKDCIETDLNNLMLAEKYGVGAIVIGKIRWREHRYSSGTGRNAVTTPNPGIVKSDS